MAIRYSFFTSIKITFSQLLLALVILPSLCFALPLEYNASYNIEKFGIVIAKSTYSLKYENNGIRMMQHTEIKGLAALLRNDTLDENSFLSAQNDQLLLNEFSYKQKSSDKKNRNIEIKIDWIKSDEKLLGNVTGTAYGKKLELVVDKPVWDTCSYQIPLMLNTKEDTEPQQYTMMIKGNFKSYSFITHGTEKIEINGRSMQTIKVERDGGAEKNPLYLWMAPELNNLPVKMEKWKNGKLYMTILLNQVQFPHNKTMNINATATEIKELTNL